MTFMGRQAVSITLFTKMLLAAFTLNNYSKLTIPWYEVFLQESAFKGLKKLLRIKSKLESPI